MDYVFCGQGVKTQWEVTDAWHCQTTSDHNAVYVVFNRNPNTQDPSNCSQLQEQEDLAITASDPMAQAACFLVPYGFKSRAALPDVGKPPLNRHIEVQKILDKDSRVNGTCFPRERIS